LNSDLQPDDIYNIIKKYYEQEKKKIDNKIHIAEPFIGSEEIISILEVLFSGWISQGKNVREFEKAFANYLGCKDAIAVNSGSSANLVALSILSDRSLGDSRISQGDEIITPALTWPTTVFPIIQIGAIPVFVDVNPDTYCIDAEKISDAITQKTKAIMPVHFMGHPANLKIITELASDYNLFVIEDACDALGAEFQGNKVGSLGDIGTFSFFTAHHITTGEGGMVVVDDSTHANLARSIRAFGRACVCPICMVAIDQSYFCPLRHQNLPSGVEDYDRRYVFTSIGYSMKLTELQAALGRIQLSRIKMFLEKRAENASYLTKNIEPLSKWLKLPTTQSWALNSNFGFPIMIKEKAPFSRVEFITYLENYNIETRPLLSGDMTKQPCMNGVSFKVSGSLGETERVSKNAFFVGCHPLLTKSNLEYVVNQFENFLSKFS